MKRNLLRTLALSTAATLGSMGMSAQTADASVVEALTAALNKASEIGDLYLKSIPFAGETARTAIEKTLPESIANVEELAKQFADAEAASAYVDGEIAKIEEALLSDIEAKATAGDAFSFEFVDIAEEGLPPYFSTSLSAVDNSSAGFITTKEISAGNLFRAEAKDDLDNGHKSYTFYTVNSNQTVNNSSWNGGGNFSTNTYGTHSNAFPLSFALKDGYVQLIVIADANSNALAFNTDKGYARAYNKEDSKTLFKLQAYSTSEVAGMAAEQIAKWGSLVPEGDKVAETVNANISAAENVAGISSLMAEAQETLLANILAAPAMIKSAATDLYIGYEDGWWANFEKEEAPEWSFTSSQKYPSYTLMKDDAAGKYIGWGLGASDTPVDNENSWNNGYYVIVLDNPGNITIFKPGSTNGFQVSGEQLVSADVMGERYINGIENYSFAFEHKAGSVAVGNIEAEGNSGVVYDLMGRRVANPGKGLYIVDGKKVLK